MRVICVNENILGVAPLRSLVKEGAEYNVVRVIEHDWGMYYEFDFHKSVGYACENFIPLSEISETNFSRNYNLKPA